MSSRRRWRSSTARFPATCTSKPPTRTSPGRRFTVDIPRETRHWPVEGPTGSRRGELVRHRRHERAHRARRATSPAMCRDSRPKSLPREQEPILLSAHTPEALRALAARWEEWLRRRGTRSGASPILRRPPPSGATTTTIVCAIVADGRRRAARAPPGLPRRRSPAAGWPCGSATRRGRPKIVFVCPGQGSQWLGMGRQLLKRSPSSATRSTGAMRPSARRPAGRLIDALRAGPGAAWLDDIAVIQPALFAIEIALAELWRSWGIKPAAVVGPQHGRGGGGLHRRRTEPRVRRPGHLSSQPAHEARERSGRHGRWSSSRWRRPRPRSPATRGASPSRSATASGPTVLSGEPPAIDEILAAPRGARGVLPAGEGGRRLAQPADGSDPRRAGREPFPG